MSRHYEFWSGGNSFLFGGRIMLGSSPVMLLATVLLEAGAFATFAVFVAPHFHWSLTLVSSVLLVLSLVSLGFCSLTDPGILPRCVSPLSDVTPEPPSHLTEVDGGPLHYCDTCHLFRPPRAKHCRFCDNCCLEFDHHCPWMGGQCIGLRNYRHFLSYVFTTLFLCLLITGLCVSQLVDVGRDDASTDWQHRIDRTLRARPASFAVGLFCGMVGASLFLLATYHLGLLRAGETTNESLRGVYRRRINPFTRGFRRNLARVLFATLPPSRLGFLAREVTGDGVAGMAATRQEMRARRNFGGVYATTADGIVVGGGGSPSVTARHTRERPQTHDGGNGGGGSYQNPERGSNGGGVGVTAIALDLDGPSDAAEDHRPLLAATGSVNSTPSSPLLSPVVSHSHARDAAAIAAAHRAPPDNTDDAHLQAQSRPFMRSDSEEQLHQVL